DRHRLDVVSGAAAGEIGGGRRTFHRGAHAVLVVLDDVEHRQIPQRRHVEGLIDLALVERAVAHVGHRKTAIAFVLVGKPEAGADGYLGADYAVAAVKALLAAEHVHGAALAL